MEVWLMVPLCIILFLVFLRMHKRYLVQWCHSPECLLGKTAIVTGANIGIGYYIAQNFATRGARVILACRNPSKAEEARKKMIEETGNKNIVVRIVDFCSLSSIRQFAKTINESEDRLDILVNNAGAGYFNPYYTEEGIKSAFQVNHLGPFLLTVLLTDLLKKSAPSRIVTITSYAFVFARLNIDNVNAPGSILGDYLHSKLCNVLFTIELAKKLKGTGVTANVVHPGEVRSNIATEGTSFVFVYFRLMMKYIYTETETGAQTPVYVAIAKELDGVSGKYFSNCEESSLIRLLRDRHLTTKLWDKSEEMVKLTDEEKRCFVEK